MPIQERTIYRSENGDCWSLVRDPDEGALFVRHRANLPSGGHTSDIDLGEFLMQGGFGPEKQELLPLIGGLVENRPDDAFASPDNEQTSVRDGRGLVTSDHEELAHDVCAALGEIEMLFGSLARQFGSAGFEHAPDDLKRAAREMANVQERITSRLKRDKAHRPSDSEVGRAATSRA